MKFQVALGCLSVLLAGCVSPRDQITVALPPQPSEIELRDFVQSHWEDYGARYSNFARRPGEKAALVSIGGVVCQAYYFVWNCTFDVTARFGDEPVLRVNLGGQYDRTSAGLLHETVLLVHERR